MLPPEFLSTAEAADLLRLHPSTLRRKIRDGEICAFRVGRKHLIPRAQFDRVAEATSLQAHTSPTDRDGTLAAPTVHGDPS